MIHLNFILKMCLAVSVLAYRQQQEDYRKRNMVSTSWQGELHSVWMRDAVKTEVDFNNSQQQPEQAKKQALSADGKVCEWANFFFETRLKIALTKQSIQREVSQYNLPVEFKQLSIIMISGAIAKLWRLREKEWTDLDLWIPLLAQWKPFLAKPVSGAHEAANQLTLPASDEENYATFETETFDGRTPPEGMPEVDAWDPVGEPLFMPEIYAFFKAFRFERKCGWWNREWDYLVIQHETPAGQLAFKIGMFSGLRQGRDFSDKDDPYQMVGAGTLEKPFRYKPTDLSDFTGALFVMLLSTESSDLHLWRLWVDHLRALEEDSPRRKWFQVYHDSDETEYYFTPMKGAQAGTIYKATFQNWLQALVPNHPGAPLGGDLCTIEKGLYIKLNPFTATYMNLHEEKLLKWRPEPKHVTIPSNPAPGIACVQNCS